MEIKAIEGRLIKKQVIHSQQEDEGWMKLSSAMSFLSFTCSFNTF
jgi:hypothetical protein